MLTPKTLLLILALVIVGILGTVATLAARAGRKRKRNVAYATEAAVHWGGEPADPELGKRSNPQLPAGRDYGLADLHKGGVKDEEVSCAHRHDAAPRVILLFSERVSLSDDIPACADCISALLVKYGTVCPACKRLVLPGDDVVISKTTRDISFEHIRAGCCDDVSRYCGVWGRHSLVSLHHLFPGSFPENQKAFHTIDRTIFGRRRLPGDRSC